MTDHESLRPVIADILEGLGDTEPHTWIRANRLHRRAETLRWTHAYEETSTGDGRTELEMLRDFARGVEDALGETDRNGKLTHPGRRLKTVAELIEANL